MPHVVGSLKNVSFDEALMRLRKVHQFIVSRAKSTVNKSEIDVRHWGTLMKRSTVNLTGVDAPELVGKSEEKLGEVINIAATIERLMDGIEWFASQPESQGCSILECHPSTSDEPSGNDLVIIAHDRRIVMRCEVCDVASSSAGSNGKEKKDIRNLGCEHSVPRDGVKRYICTAPEFGNALTSRKRKWRTKPYRYKAIQTGMNTWMLLICPADVKIE